MTNFPHPLSLSLSKATRCDGPKFKRLRAGFDKLSLSGIWKMVSANVRSA